MDDHWRKTFHLWSKKQEHEQLVEKTSVSMRAFIEKYRCVVAYSGGKDSTVMLHLALQIDPIIQVFHWDQGPQLMPCSIQKEILANARALGAQNLIVESWKGSDAEDMRVNPEKWRSAHLIHYLVLNRLRRDLRWDFQFVGLRKEEGCKRSAVCKHPRKGEVYPLADWRWLDVWACIVSRGLPYPRAYDLYAPLLGWDRARFVNFFSMRFENYGSPYLDGFLLPEKRNLSTVA
jgi:3'-phosphoadenosine 5'-phosphosulfate sulfotransferase (PAPS reductase)/FAD synthetase